jgi:hypothetical protein
MSRAIWTIGLIGLAVVIFFIVRETGDRREETPPAPPVQRTVPKPEAGIERMQCPVCQGYGYILVPDRTGMRRQMCQFCGGKGGKELWIPPGNVKCPDCEGFGRMRVGATDSVICSRCGGRGYVKAPFQPPS